MGYHLADGLRDAEPRVGYHLSLISFHTFRPSLAVFLCIGRFIGCKIIIHFLEYQKVINSCFENNLSLSSLRPDQAAELSFCKHALIVMKCPRDPEKKSD